MLGGSLIDFVMLTMGALITMALLSCLCCLCMKISDLKMKKYILETANVKGVKVDLERLETKHLSPLSNENCAIMVPEVVIVL